MRSTLYWLASASLIVPFPIEEFLRAPESRTTRVPGHTSMCSGAGSGPTATRGGKRHGKHREKHGRQGEVRYRSEGGARDVRRGFHFKFLECATSRRESGPMGRCHLGRILLKCVWIWRLRSVVPFALSRMQSLENATGIPFGHGTEREAKMVSLSLESQNGRRRAAVSHFPHGSRQHPHSSSQVSALTAPAPDCRPPAGPH